MNTDRRLSADTRVWSQGVMAADSMVGQRVKLQGLVSRPELNGLSAVVHSFNDEKGRYVVRLPDIKDSLLLKATSLEPLGPAAGAQGSRVNVNTKSLGLRGSVYTLKRGVQTLYPDISRHIQPLDI